MTIPFRLADACALFPQARLTVSTLRAEAARGRLKIFRLGRRDYTTRRDMQEMIARCRDEDYRHDSTSIRARQQWAILDGTNFVRTGCAHDELAKAERVLAEYIGQKYQPERSPAPPVADILLAYLRDKVPTMKSRSTKYYVSNLAAWWSDKTLADVTAANCRAYAKNKTQVGGARRSRKTCRSHTVLARGIWTAR